VSLPSKRPQALPKTLKELEEEMREEEEKDLTSKKDFVRVKTKTDKVIEIAKNEPSEAATLIKKWLEED